MSIATKMMPLGSRDTQDSGPITMYLDINPAIMPYATLGFFNKAFCPTDIVIDFGNGVVYTYDNLSSDSTSSLSYMYPDRTQTYTVSITSSMEWGSARSNSPRFGNVNLISVYGKCPKLATFQSLIRNSPNCSYIAPDFFHDVAERVTSLEYAFNITGFQLPEGLLDGMINNTSIQYAFQGNKSTYIPTGFLKDHINITSVIGAFQSSFISGPLPSDIFQYNTKIYDADYCFQSTRITSIDTNSFRTLSTLATAYSMFGYCLQLENIVGTGGLFNNSNTNLWNISNLFIGCTKLSSVDVLCNGCPEIFSADYALDSCTGITTVGALFVSCPKLATISRCCGNDTSITSNVPTLWTIPTITNGTNCFLNCTNAANYASIPVGWK